MKKFTLPISPTYVAHWGLWEAVRELWQNAMDARDSQKYLGNDATAEMTRYPNLFSPTASSLVISNSGNKLLPATLILGSTSKADDPDQRGKFGEGYKLALLVLCRMGYDVIMLNGDETWTPKIERDETFGADVLNIYTEFNDRPDDAGVEINIQGVCISDLDAIDKNIIPFDSLSRNRVLEDASQKGRVYVGGLYVCTVPNFECGYSLCPGTVALDRDRGIVSNSDLTNVASQLWAEHEDNGSYGYQLLKKGAPDLGVAHYYAVSPSSKLVTNVANAFTAEHGTAAVPVANQNEIERATNAGVKWVLVPEGLKRILGRVINLFIPSTKSPVERLRAFVQKYHWELNTDMRSELEDIVKSMSPVAKESPQ